MKKTVFLLIVVLVAMYSFALNPQELALVHNIDFALSQTMQVDTIKAKLYDNSKVVLSELKLKDLYPTNYEETSDYYRDFNDNIHSLELIEIKRERLEYLYKSKQKSALTALVPNALGILTTVVSVGMKDPKAAIIAVAGTVVSSVTNYLGEREKVNLEYVQAGWELDDNELETMYSLGTQLYQYKCSITKALNVPIERVLSNTDLEDFIQCSKIEDAGEKLIKLRSINLNGELELLPEYWAELAKAAFENEEYLDCLDYVDMYETVYCPITKHDRSHAYIMMIKTYCESIVFGNSPERYSSLCTTLDEILRNVEQDDLSSRLYCVSLYLEMYKNTKEVEYADLAFNNLGRVLLNAMDEYSKDYDDYLKGSYREKGISYISDEIKKVNEQLASKKNQILAYKKGKTKKELKDDMTLKIYQEEQLSLEEKLNSLKEDQKMFKQEAKMILPPSSDFLVSILKSYFEIAAALKKKESSDYKIIEKKARDLLGNTDYIAARELFDDFEYDYSSVEFKATLKNHKLSIRMSVPLCLLDVSKELEGTIIDSQKACFYVSIDGTRYRFNAVDWYIGYGSSVNTSYLVALCEGEISFPLSKEFKNTTHEVSFGIRNGIKDDAEELQYLADICLPLNQETDAESYKAIIDCIRYQ